MKATYDLRVNSRGSVQPMACGFFEKTHDLVYSTPLSADALVTIETPTCFVRVRKDDVSTAPFVEHIRGYFARHRVHPQRPCFTQFSTKKGQWINGKVFGTEEEARTYVDTCNARLAPFSDSPYVAEEVDA